MHFTVIFEGDPGDNWAYGLSFLPSPIWLKQGSGEPDFHLTSEVSQPAESTLNYLRILPTTPDLEPGAVQALLDHELGLAEAVHTTGRAVIVTHDGGHATSEDLQTLADDLRQHEIQVSIFENHSEDHQS